MVTFCKLQKGMVIGDHYEIVKFLGRGSMGAVYQARDNYFEEHDRIVACKILPQELRQTPGREVYFKREFLAAQELVHQNICCTYEFGEDQPMETYYLIMEYVKGKTLRDETAKKEYTLEQALPIIEQIAVGLDFAHNKGILHLDMKPDNVIVTDEGHIKIMDFGLARVVNKNMTHVSLMDVEGTPLYMAPEQINPKTARKRVDYAVDRWALGVMSYEIIAGYPPFDGRMGITPLIYSILNAEPEPLEIDRGAWLVIQKMLAKDPKERFQTCKEFYKVLANPNISNTSYIPIREPLPETKRKEKDTMTSLLPLDSPETRENLPAALTDTDISLDASYSHKETAENHGTSMVSLDSPDEILDSAVNVYESSIISMDENSKAESDDMEILDSETSRPDPAPKPAQKKSITAKITKRWSFLSKGQDLLPAFVWKQVKGNYAKVQDIEKAHHARGFKFFSVNQQNFLIYRHLHSSMDFVLVPSGNFFMGSPREEGKEDEHPLHKVQIRAYFLSTNLVTQETWQKIMKTNPASFDKGGKYPVEQISWLDLQEFCNKTELEIPTEAQWERACRADTNSTFFWGEDFDEEYCWCNENSGRQIHPVAQKKPNDFGFYDMCGNLWEWCRDDYASEAYRNHGKIDPIYKNHSDDDAKKVRRGGSWLNRPDGCRCAIRQCDEPTRKASGLGARVSYSL